MIIIVKLPSREVVKSCQHCKKMDYHEDTNGRGVWEFVLRCDHCNAVGYADVKRHKVVGDAVTVDLTAAGV